MASREDYGTYSIHIEGRWSLGDLYVFPRAYEQVYFALEAILPAPDSETNQRIERAFRAFPWRGGYSAVSFYNQLKWATPPRERPEVASIHYSSPGWMEFALLVPLAYSVAAVVNKVADTIYNCNRVYNAIYSDMQKRELLKIEIERKKIGLKSDEIELIKDYSDTMAAIMGLNKPDQIHERTKDPLISLKILFSIFRRVRTLAEYKNMGKAQFHDSKELKNDNPDVSLF